MRAIYILLLVPYIAMLWVPSYNRATPELAGVPFFYWYQLVWILLGSLLLFLTWRVEGSKRGSP